MLDDSTTPPEVMRAIMFFFDDSPCLLPQSEVIRAIMCTASPYLLHGLQPTSKAEIS